MGVNMDEEVMNLMRYQQSYSCGQTYDNNG